MPIDTIVEDTTYETGINIETANDTIIMKAGNRTREPVEPKHA